MWYRRHELRLCQHAAVGLVTASGDTKCKIITAASEPTLSLTIEAAATKNNTAASSATTMEVLPRPAVMSTQINPEASPQTDDRAVVEGATPG
jgi:hypothetical protein